MIDPSKLTDTALIDADWLVYATATSPDYLVETWDEANDEYGYTLHGGAAIEAIASKSEELAELAQCGSYVLCFGAFRNFRKELYKSYKTGEQRKSRKPLGYGALVKRLCETAPCVYCDGLEGDDVMGILATHEPSNVIVSVDKDMRTVPAKHYNPGKPELGVMHYTEQEAAQWTLLQTLCGDRTDGIAGCPGLGEKRAAPKVAKYSSVGEGFEDCVVPCFEKAGLTWKDALDTLRQVHIVQASDIVVRGRMKLYTPSCGMLLDLPDEHVTLGEFEQTAPSRPVCTTDTEPNPDFEEFMAKHGIEV